MATRARRTAAARPAANGSADDTAAQVLRRFRQVFKAVKTHLQQVEKQVGLGGAQVWALSIVGANPGIGVGELARAMDIHQSTASNLARGLIERALIAAEREGADRRAVQLRLLPAGARLLRKAPAPFSGVLPSALRRLDAQSLERLNQDLGRLIAQLGATDARAGRVPLADL
jgi:DNA-binding MarR family transcriptional regulator